MSLVSICNFLRRGRNAFWPLGEVVKMGSPFTSFTSVGLGVEIFVTHQFLWTNVGFNFFAAPRFGWSLENTNKTYWFQKRGIMVLVEPRSPFQPFTSRLPKPRVFQGEVFWPSQPLDREAIQLPRDSFFVKASIQYTPLKTNIFPSKLMVGLDEVLSKCFFFSGGHSYIFFGGGSNASNECIFGCSANANDSQFNWRHFGPQNDTCNIRQAPPATRIRDGLKLKAEVVKEQPPK